MFFVPYRELLDDARRLGAEYFDAASVRVEYVHTEQIARRARALEQEGCDLLIARGAQAERLKQAVRLPVIEFRASTQAIGRSILALKCSLGEALPQLALIALANTIPDTTYYDELFGVSLRVYTSAASSQLPALVDRARRDGCKAVIGGNTVLDRARQIGLPGVFLRSGEESIRTAYDTARRVAYAIDLEKRRAAEIDAMLNHTAGGVLQVDLRGVICRVNHVCLRILGCGEEALLGRALPDVLPQITREALEDFARSGEETRAFVADVRSKTVVLNAAAIHVEGKPDSLILTIQEGDAIRRLNSELRAELNRRGFLARHTFREFVADSAESAALVRSAKRMAGHDAPVTLTGCPDAGADLLAECIHNESPFRHNAFVTVDCSAYSEEELDNLLFGNYTARRDTPASLTELAQNGTLYLKNVEALSPHTQYKVAQLLRGRFHHNGVSLPVALRTRVIASTGAALARCVEERRFRADLYYALQVFQLELTPLKKRREDIPGWFRYYWEQWQTRHARPVRLTEGAARAAAQYDWPGGLPQMSCVCERAVLLCERRAVGEDFLRAQLDQLAPRLAPGTDAVVVYKDPKAAEIAALLRQYGGSRARVAQELGVSKTTLWRYMKKYGIGPDFSY